VDECKPLVTGGGRGNPDISNLGRKWNVCVVGRGLHSSTSQLNLNRFGHTSPCPPV